MRSGIAILILLAGSVLAQRPTSAIYPSTGGGGGGASAATDLTDCKVTRTNSTTLTMSACRVTIGHVLFTMAETTFTLSTSVSDTAYLYVLNGAWVVGYSNASTTITASGWSTTDGITAFPAASKPIAYWPATSTPGAWNTTGTDMRALPQGAISAAGNGITVTCSDTTGVCTIAVDTTSVPQFTTSTSDASGNCTTGQIWINTSSDSVWDCTHTNTWTARGGGSVTASSTTTFTNKTVDVEGTGNSVTTVDHFWFRIGRGNPSGTFNWMIDYGSTGPNVSGMYTPGADITYTGYPFIYFTDADGPAWIAGSVLMPSDWDPSKSTDLLWTWHSSGTSGNRIFQCALACQDNGDAASVKFNTATEVTETSGSASAVNKASATGLSTTGCSAGDLLTWRILVDRTHASDTLSGATGFLGGVLLRFRRTQ
jgi:hypothetical protein